MIETPSGSGGGVFYNIGKFLWMCVSDAKWRNTIIFTLMIIGFLYKPIVTSFEEGTPRPFLDKFVSSIASGDNGINIEVEKAKALKEQDNFKFWRMLLSLGKLMILFYFSFYFIGFLIWNLYQGKDQTSSAKNLTLTVITLIFIQIAGSVYIIASDNQGNMKENFHFIVGEKTFVELVQFLNPVKGVWNLIQNYHLYLEPIANIGEKLQH